MSTKQQTLWWGLGIVVLIAVALGAYVFWRAWGVSEPVITSVVVKEEHPEAYYSLDVQYPKVSGLKDAVVAEAINASIQQQINANIAAFVTGATEMKKPPFPGAMSTLQVSYSIEHMPEHFAAVKDERGEIPPVLSLLFRELPYYAGAAHPNGSATSTNVDMRSGEKVLLSDLFVPESKPLELLAKAARADLQKQFEPFASKSLGLDAWMQQGTEPTDENYAVWFVRKDGLVLVFNPYQVAPYVFGERQVIVPWTMLKSRLREEWQTLLVK